MTRAAAAVVAAVALTGCGSDEDDRRSSVNAYIDKVNATQRDAFAEWNRATTAYAAVGRGELTDRQLRNLAEAPRTIRTLRTRIAGLTPPDDAKLLRKRLLRLLDLQANVAAEVSAFARYVEAVSPLEEQVARETLRLRATLQRARTAQPEEEALTQYASRLDDVQERLGQLQPPPALAPWHADQVARVSALRNGARSAARGVVKADLALIREGVAVLTDAAVGKGVSAADRAAIDAYNRRLIEIRKAAGAVAREQTRLSRELG
jgi:hypothetical protein